MRSGIHLQQHFEVSDTLETVSKWGQNSHAISNDSSEEFFITHPPIRFTPLNLKRTLGELRLPKSVLLCVVKRTKRALQAAQEDVLRSENIANSANSNANQIYPSYGQSNDSTNNNSTKSSSSNIGSQASSSNRISAMKMKPESRPYVPPGAPV